MDSEAVTQDQAPAPVPVVKARAISKRYGQLCVLREMNLAIPEGSFCCLFGPNGSGKSTLLQILAGVTPPDSGIVEIHGVDLGKYPRRGKRELAFMPQGLGLEDRLSVARHLQMEWSLRGIPVDSRQKTARDLLEQLGLAEFADTPAGKLSSGMKQALAFCRSALVEPAVLLLDEPTAGLDSPRRARVWQHLRKLAGRGTAVIVASHLPDEILECDLLLALRSGTSGLTLPVEELMRFEVPMGKVFLPRWPSALNPAAAFECPGIHKFEVHRDGVILWIDANRSLDDLRAALARAGLPKEGLRPFPLDLEDRIDFLVGSPPFRRSED